MNKMLASILLLFLSMGSVSALEIPGKVFYSIKRTGDVVSRDMILDLPEDRKGKIVVRAQGMNFSLEAKKSFTRVKRGKETFYLATTMKAPDFAGGQKSAMVFKGTYLKGKNVIKYYGDVYSKNIEDENELDGIESKEDCLEGYEFKGGFSFEAEI